LFFYMLAALLGRGLPRPKPGARSRSDGKDISGGGFMRAREAGQRPCWRPNLQKRLGLNKKKRPRGPAGFFRPTGPPPAGFLLGFPPVSFRSKFFFTKKKKKTKGAGSLLIFVFCFPSLHWKQNFPFFSKPFSPLFWGARFRLSGHPGPRGKKKFLGNPESRLKGAGPEGSRPNALVPPGHAATGFFSGRPFFHFDEDESGGDGSGRRPGGGHGYAPH